MTKILVLCGLVAAIAAPAALAADPVPADFKNGAKYCQALRTAKGVEAFEDAAGHQPEQDERVREVRSATNKAKAKKADDEKADDAAESKATAACKKQQSENATKFAQDYKNFGQCVKSQKANDNSD